MIVDFTFDERAEPTPPPRRTYGVTDVTPHDVAEILNAIEAVATVFILRVYGIRNGGMRLALARVSYQSPLEISTFITRFGRWASAQSDFLTKLIRAFFDRVMFYEAERSKHEADAAHRWAEVRRTELENIQFILQMAKEFELDRADVEVLLKSVHSLTNTRLVLTRVAVAPESTTTNE